MGLTCREFNCTKAHRTRHACGSLIHFTQQTSPAPNIKEVQLHMQWQVHNIVERNFRTTTHFYCLNLIFL
uniref:Uncharacterized protein n=1 Tax=Setaria italica TaxID=4555 RepID=K3ZBI7_SETIT